MTPGDWDAAGITVGDLVTAQFVTLYEALRSFDDSAAERTLTTRRLCFAGADDNIAYGPGWGDTVVRIAEPLRQHRDELTQRGWDIELLPGLDHMGAMHSSIVLPLLGAWLTANSPATRR